MIIYIKPYSAFPSLSSDKLFGAVISAISEIFPEKIEHILKSFGDKNPPFLISSTFPYFENKGKKLRFFPIPIHKPLSSDDIINKKKFNKIQYIDEVTFKNLLKGELSIHNLFTEIGLNYYIVNELFLLNKYNSDFFSINKHNSASSEIIKPPSRKIQQHNTIDRISNHSKDIFYSENLMYSEEGGTFFLVDFLDDMSKELFLSALKFLRDRGFGKDISIGNGHFDCSICEDFSLSNEVGSYFISLSRFLPTSNEIEKIKQKKHNTLYEIDFKRSKDRNGRIRKQIKFFTEGSVFPLMDNICGSMIYSGKKAVDYGYSYMIKYNLGD